MGKKVSRVPHIPLLKEDNVREGFFDSNECLAVLGALPSYVRTIATFGYRMGWRKNEMLSLTWERLNLKERTVSLTKEQTKNKEARNLYLDDKLLKRIRLQRMRRGKCPSVFHRDGKKISNFVRSWKKACKKVNLEGRLFHDFRRTAARNLTRSGTKETLVMKITGHQTSSAFDRYYLTNDYDI